MTLKQRIILCFIIVGMIFMRVHVYLSIKKRDSSFLHMKIDGRVEDIIYDVKDFPSIWIKHERYDLGAPYDFGHKLQVGDSLYKANGNMVFKLVKKNTGEIIYFKN